MLPSENPPPSLLEAECAKNTAFTLALFGSLPAVTAVLTTEPLEDGDDRPDAPVR